VCYRKGGYLAITDANLLLGTTATHVARQLRRNAVSDQIATI
jgi:N-methylhydantoinase A/oxoprolinase/acetone carboxylase beta subunit